MTPRDEASRLQADAAEPSETSMMPSEPIIEALNALRALPEDASVFPLVFRAFADQIDFDLGLFLLDRGEGYICKGATAPELVGRLIYPGHRAEEPAIIEALREFPSNSLRVGSVLRLSVTVGVRSGLLVLVRDEAARAFGTDERSVAEGLSLLVSGALTRFLYAEAAGLNRCLTRLTEKLEQQAHFDDLTGLPNRYRFNTILNEMIERGREHPFALACIDVNKFKHINDYYGHDTGDRLLVSMAERISEVLRPEDSAARLAGDEFIIVFEGMSDPVSVDRLLEQITARLNGPLRIGSFTVHSSVSVGVARFPEHSADAAELRRHADAAVKRAKSKPGGAIVHFEKTMAEDVSARLDLETRLRRAIELGNFTPVFQPQIDIRRANVAGFEVLLRWQDEDGVLHAPASFLQVAGELGLINRITEITALKVAHAIPLLTERFGSEITVSLNIVAGQATNAEFLQRLMLVLEPERYGGRVTFEITEDQFLDLDCFLNLVRPLLDRHQVRLSIDDFGKGYSSLSALAGLSAHEVKVDRDFVTDVRNDPSKQRVLRMIEYYAQASGMNCVVEGAETCEDVRYILDKTRVAIVQGFCFGRPMTLDEVLAWQPDYSPLGAKQG